VDALSLLKLGITGFRNIERLELTPARRFNVISGDNGQGKTSVLEAIYFVATSKSFRSERLGELRRDGAEFARVDAEIEDGALTRSQRGVLSSAGRVLKLDGNPPGRLSRYVTLTPVVVFHPGDLELSMGGAGGRRDLLDRIGLFQDPTLADDRRRYRQALRERQAALDARGSEARELDAFENLVAEHGARLGQARALASERLAEDAVGAFERLVAGRLPLTLRYRPGGALDASELSRELRVRRAQDRRRRAATFGPHKDELELLLDGRPARHHASQGQHRILSLSLKLAELSTIRRARGAHPLLLLDDVSSELDPTRIGLVYDSLRESQSQVFVSTTRPDLFETPGLGTGERHDYELENGALKRAS
jgi:DNA replication and repair protein RecF